MRNKTDLQKIHYILKINNRDVISGNHKTVAKRYIQELYDNTIQEHDRFARMHEQGLITLDECIHFQTNCIRYIRLLKQLNSKHKLLERLID